MLIIESHSFIKTKYKDKTKHSDTERNCFQNGYQNLKSTNQQMFTKQH